MRKRLDIVRHVTGLSFSILVLWFMYSSRDGDTHVEYCDMVLRYTQHLELVRGIDAK